MPNLVNIGFVIDWKNVFKTDKINIAVMGFQAIRKVRLGTWMTPIFCSHIHERRPPDSKFKTPCVRITFNSITVSSHSGVTLLIWSDYTNLLSAYYPLFIYLLKYKLDTI